MKKITENILTSAAMVAGAMLIGLGPFATGTYAGRQNDVMKIVPVSEGLEIRRRNGNAELISKDRVIQNQDTFRKRFIDGSKDIVLNAVDYDSNGINDLYLLNMRDGEFYGQYDTDGNLFYSRGKPGVTK